MNETPLTHAELDSALARLRLGVGASDLHGSLTGYLCAGGSAGLKGWPDALQLEADFEGWRDDAMLVRLYRCCSEQLADDELGFEPLLPEDDRPLVQRGDALVEWCRGFLGGVGLAGIARSPGLSDDAVEILGDFSTIAATAFDYDEDDGDETALIEVLEFVRIGVLLLHTEMARKTIARSTSPNRRVH